MLRKLSCIVAGLWMATATTSVTAHHSFSSYWNGGAMITWQGTVAKFDWMNPHTYLYLDMKDATGRTEHWAFEFYDISKLTRAGLAKDSLKAGDSVTVFGFAARENGVFDYLENGKDLPSDYAKAKRFGRAKEITLANGKHIVMPL